MGQKLSRKSFNGNPDCIIVKLKRSHNRKYRKGLLTRSGVNFQYYDLEDNQENVTFSKPAPGTIRKEKVNKVVFAAKTDIWKMKGENVSAFFLSGIHFPPTEVQEKDLKTETPSKPKKRVTFEESHTNTAAPVSAGPQLTEQERSAVVPVVVAPEYLALESEDGSAGINGKNAKVDVSDRGTAGMQMSVSCTLGESSGSSKSTLTGEKNDRNPLRDSKGVGDRQKALEMLRGPGCSSEIKYTKVEIVPRKNVTTAPKKKPHYVNCTPDGKPLMMRSEDSGRVQYSKVDMIKTQALRDICE